MIFTFNCIHYSQHANIVSFESTSVLMKNLDRKVTLLCPLCGNDQFSSLDEEFEDLLHASDDVRVRCSDCGSEYTKRELLDSNAAIIDNAVDELAQDAVKELEKELKKAMKKWKF